MTGQLGWELQRALACLGDVFSFNRQALDLTKAMSIREAVGQIHPEVIVNAAAFTDVDLAQDQSDLAYKVNAEALSIMAQEAARSNCAVIHYSTDYVFDGSQDHPYTEQGVPNPLNVYGKTKLEGETFLRMAGAPYWIFRTSWLYSLRRDNFALKVLGWSHSQEKMRIVEDQIGSPTWARLLAQITGQALAIGRNDPTGWIEQTKGVYHLAGDGFCSRYDFAREIINRDPDRANQKVTELLPAKTKDFPSNVSRPSFSGLDCTLFKEKFNLQLPSWQEGLKLMLVE
jgi:dTDP-4-dehydrorhamnose reductase